MLRILRSVLTISYQVHKFMDIDMQAILATASDRIVKAAQKHYRYMLQLYAEESGKASISFPEEIWKIIFSFMDATTLFTASLTCRKFRKLALGTELR